MMLCGCCGEALGMEDERVAQQMPVEQLLCSQCWNARPNYQRAVAYGVYQDELREMVHLLKYERVRSIAKPLGAMLANAITMLHRDAARQLLVIAVPLFPAKQHQRGYNQAVLLSDAALARLSRSQPEWALQPSHDTLRRVRDTESQFALTPKGRSRNLQGAFAVQPDALIVGREVLLIDDIYTTGATARECARVLLRAGASKVWVATLARAQTEMAERWSDSLG